MDKSRETSTHSALKVRGLKHGQLEDVNAKHKSQQLQLLKYSFSFTKEYCKVSNKNHVIEGGILYKTRKVFAKQIGAV